MLPLIGEYGKYLKEKGREYEGLVVLEADLKEATQTVQFESEFPDRFFQIGIAEQNMVGIAAGFALGGKIPMVHTFAAFISMRACEQIRTSIAYPNLNVKLIGSFGGLSAGSAGTTHHAIEDIAILRSMPNMTVLVPGDIEEMKQVIDASLSMKGPVYIRLSFASVEYTSESKHPFSVGQARELRSGSDATIISTGTLVRLAIHAADLLKESRGIGVRVLQAASIKPLDTEAVRKAAKETGCIVTVEEHSVIGGLGSSVCEFVAENSSAKVKRIGIQDSFCGVGTCGYLHEKEGLTAERISQELITLLNGE